METTDEVGVPLAGFAEALAATARAEEAGLCDQVVRLGRQTAYERLVHLILELYERLQKVGLVDGDSFSIPLTQELLADALGLSVVHINRTLQQVRRDKLLEMQSGRVTLLQPDRMRLLADWADPQRAVPTMGQAGTANSALSDHRSTQQRPAVGVDHAVILIGDVPQ